MRCLFGMSVGWQVKGREMHSPGSGRQYEVLEVSQACRAGCCAPCRCALAEDARAPVLSICRYLCRVDTGGVFRCMAGEIQKSACALRTGQCRASARCDWGRIPHTTLAGLETGMLRCAC